MSNSNIDVNEFMRVLNNYPTEHIFLGSDWHLFKKEVTGLHENEITSQLNKFIKLHNSKIDKNDVFIYLGDLLHRNCKQEHFTKLKDFISKLNGIKILIKGNHDLKPDEFYIDCGFNYVCDNLQINDVIFTHKPCDLKDFPDAKINIHGHMHEENFYDVNTNDDHIKIYTPDHDILSLKSVLKKESTETNKPVDKNLISDYVKELKSKYQKMVDKFFKENPKYKEMPLEEIYKNQEKISREFIKKSGIKETEGFTLSIRRHQTNDEEFKKYPKLDTQKNFYRVVIYDRDNNIVIDLFPQLQNQKTHVKHDMEDLTKNFWKTYTSGYSNKTYRKDDVIKFYKTQLESVKEDDMNIATLNKDDLTEQTVTESKIFNKPNFEINIDKWGYGNPLWITGGSGDGKSTLAENMAKQHNAIHVNLDIFLIRCTGTPEKFQKMLHDPMIGNSTILLDYINQHPEIPWRNVHTWEYDMTSECADLFKWILNAAKTKYRNKLLIVEGCDICRMNPKLACTLPLIVIGVSELTQSLHRIKRDTTELDDNGQHKHGIIDAIFRELRRRTRYGNLLNQYKYDFLKNVKSTLNESTELQLEIYEAERNGKITLQERNTLLNVISEKTSKKEQHRIDNFLKKNDYDPKTQTIKSDIIGKDGKPTRIPFKMTNKPDKEAESYKKRDGSYGIEMPRTTIKRKPAISQGTLKHEEGHIAQWIDPEKYSKYHKQVQLFIDSIDKDCFDHDLEIEEYIADLYAKKHSGYGVSGIEKTLNSLRTTTHQIHQVIKKMDKFTDKDVEDNYQGYLNKLESDMSMIKLIEQTMEHRKKLLNDYVKKASLEKSSDYDDYIKRLEAWISDNEKTLKRAHELYDKAATNLNSVKNDKISAYKKDLVLKKSNALNNKLTNKNLLDNGIDARIKYQKMTEAVELKLEIYEAERNEEINIHERDFLLSILESSSADQYFKFFDWVETLTTIKPSDITKILAFTKKNRNDVYIANLNPAGLHVELKLGSYAQKAPITWACRSDEWIEPEMWENLKSFITNHKTILNSKNVIQHVNKVYGFSICDKINIWDAMMYVEYIELSPWSDKITVVCGNSWDKEHEVIIYVKNNKIEHLD